MKPTTFLLVSAGSWGDAIPLAVVGGELRRRGHTVWLMTAERFRRLALDFDLNFAPLSSGERAEDHAKALRELSKMSKVSNFTSETFVDYSIRWNRNIYRKILDLNEEGSVLTVTSHHGSIIADYLAHQFAGIPMARLMLQPGPPTRTAGVNPLSKWDSHAERSAEWMHILLRELGQPPMTESMLLWTKRVSASLKSWELWPKWFARGAQVSQNSRALGFVRDTRYDRLYISRNPGPPRKIAFVLGTLGTDPQSWVERYYDFAEEVCALLGCCGYFLGASEPPAGCVPSGRLQCHEFLPLAEALSDSDILVHHAGMGTIAHGLAHGIPHLAIPRIWGQTDNAATLKLLGVAEILDPQGVSARSAMVNILRLCESEQVRVRCDYLKSLMDEAQTVPHICDLLENCAGLSSPTKACVRPMVNSRES